MNLITYMFNRVSLFLNGRRSVDSIVRRFNRDIDRLYARDAALRNRVTSRQEAIMELESQNHTDLREADDALTIAGNLSKLLER